MFRTGQHRAATDTLIEHIATLDPSARSEKLATYREFTAEGKLRNWSMSWCNIRALPESFGALECEGLLTLSDNELTCLPRSFGNIVARGNLDLRFNKLESLPEHFNQIVVGGYLCLSRSYFAPGKCPQPDAFPNVTELSLWPRHS